MHSAVGIIAGLHSARSMSSQHILLPHTLAAGKRTMTAFGKGAFVTERRASRARRRYGDTYRYVSYFLSYSMFELMELINLEPYRSQTFPMQAVQAELL